MDLFLLGFLVVFGLFLLNFGYTGLRDGFGARAGLAGLGGLALLIATVWRIYPALTDTDQAARIVKLQTDLAASQQAQTALRADKAKADSEIKTLNSQRVEMETTLNRQMTSVAEEVDRLKTHWKRPESGLVVEPPGVRTGSIVPASDSSQLDRIVTDIRTLRDARVAATPQVAVRQDQTRDLMQLKDKMATKLTTPSYDVEVYPEKELVGGRSGKYYVVDLKNAASGIRYYFDGGKYTLAKGQPEFRASLNSFIGDVLAKMNGNVRYDLFVRGSADRKPYEGKFEPGFEYREIKYMKGVGNDRYLNEVAEDRIDSVVSNKDLPNLRAMFLKSLIADIYPVKPPIVLEGRVSPASNDKDRNAEIILFVDW